MMLRNSALVLLTVFIATTNAAEDIGTCPLTAPYSPETLVTIDVEDHNSMVDCSDAGGFASCFYNAEEGGGSNSLGDMWDCRCAGEGSDGSNWFCHFEHVDDGTDETMDMETDSMDMEMDSGAAAITVLSSLIASGAVAATVFGL